MALDFPNSPTNGQTFTANGNTWTYDGSKWNASNLDTKANTASPIMTGTVIAGSKLAVGTTSPSAYATAHIWQTDNPVLSVEDYGNGVGYLAQAGNVTLLGAEAEFRIRNGISYGSGPISSGVDRFTINTSGHITKPYQPIWNSDITSTTNGYATFSPSINIGFTATNTSTITVQTAGKYFVRAQQLMQTAGAGYWQIRKNDVTQKHAYSSGSFFMDFGVECTLDLAAGDTIRLVATMSLTNSWNGAHSNLDIIKVA